MGPWLKQVLFAEAAPGIANALLVTQVSLVLCGLMVVLLLPFALPQTAPAPLRFLAKGLFLLMRCIPEYILAFFLMLSLGPSMLPAILTVSGHNAGLLAHIMANASAALQPRVAARRAADRYLHDLLPRIYGQVLAFLFYRWETMLRESAILGVLGVGTVGFFIKQNLALDRPDRAALLILLAGLTTLAIDLLSSRIRRQLRLSSDFSAGRCGEG
jgi:phosphonate transport system permease protein